MYHALQDSKDIASLEDLRTMDKETDDLREAIVTARVKEKLLRASLVSVTATMSINDIQASIITLQSEKKMILARLEPLMAGSIEPASLQEKEEIDRAWKDWSQKANVIKRLCMELWAFCTEELQEQSKQDLWVRDGSCTHSNTHADLVVSRMKLASKQMNSLWSGGCRRSLVDMYHYQLLRKCLINYIPILWKLASFPIGAASVTKFVSVYASSKDT